MNLGSGGVHVLLEHSNRGKRSLALDLSTPAGLNVLHQLIALSDVFLTNKLPRVRQSLQIELDDVRKHNKDIIYVRGTGYGNFGPDADKGGYDILGYWCRSGLAYGATPPDVDRVISQPGPAYGDSIGAMTIAGGIAAALFHRQRTGEAPVVDVSLLATGMWAMGAGIALSLQLGVPWQHPPKVREDIQNPLTNGYRTKDGHWIFLSCLQGFHYWPDACRAIEREELIADERFSTPEAFMANAFTAMTILQQVFAERTMEQWKIQLAGFRGQWAPVQDSIEVTTDPQVEANGYVVEAQTTDGTPFSLVASPVQFDEAPSQTRRAPDFNEHGDEILTGLLGMEWEHVLDLKVQGVVA